MSDLFHKFQDFNKKQAIFSLNGKTLVAVSGGVDSVVLVHLMSKAKISLGVAHCNFSLRGKEADKDQQFVEKIAAQLSVPFHTINFETASHATKNGISTQMAARALRYKWFEEIKSNFDYQKVATAHHADDQIETILFNLTKGSGIAGLRGIKTRTELTIRPLLFASKAEIIDYARSNKLEWREDVSNKEDKYSRNLLRNRVIPLLRDINPGLGRTIFDNQERYTALEKLLNARTEIVQSKNLAFKDNGYEFKLGWYNEKEGSFSVLENTLKTFGFNLDQCLQIRESLEQSGKQFFSDNYLLIIDRHRLLIESRNEKQDFELSIPEDTKQFELNENTYNIKLTQQKVKFDGNNNSAFLDADKVKFPLKVRNWLKGDHFIPLGMKGKKKISDFMIDQKIPVNLKRKIAIFESNGEIFWIAGHRIDDRYKVTSKTQSTLIIKMTRNA